MKIQNLNEAVYNKKARSNSVVRRTEKHKKQAQRSNALSHFSYGEYEYSDDNYYYSGDDGIEFEFDGVHYSFYYDKDKSPEYDVDVYHGTSLLSVKGKPDVYHYGLQYDNPREFDKESDMVSKKADMFIRSNIAKGNNPKGLDRKQALRLADLIDNEADLDYDLLDILDDADAEAEEDDDHMFDMNRSYYSGRF